MANYRLILADQIQTCRADLLEVVYHQLKGGQVDYGANHSKKYGLIQKPSDKIYKGLYMEWGSNNPVHLVGHSMGGQTARMLQYLLENEIFIDDSLGFTEDSDLLGKSKEGWVSSITSLATRCTVPS